jgi:hypothetical protein
VSGNGAWRLVVGTSAATAGSTTLSVEVVVSLARGSRAQVDDISLKRG